MNQTKIYLKCLIRVKIIFDFHVLCDGINLRQTDISKGLKKFSTKVINC